METLTIPEANMLFVQVKLVGTEPGLLLNPFGQKAQQQLLDSMTKKSPKLRADKDPEREYKERLKDVTIDPKAGLYGMNVLAFKNAIVRGGKSIKGVKMTEMRSAFFVEMDSVVEGQPLAHIHGTPTRDTRPVRNKSGTDLRTRVLLIDWEYVLRFTINESLASIDQILSATVNAGRGTGVGDFRPEKNGIFGRWEVAEAHSARLEKAEAAE